VSNDRQNSKRKRKFSIDPVRVTDQDQASVKRVLGRLTGRVPFPETDGGSASGDTQPGSTTHPEGTTQLTGNTVETGTASLAGNTQQAGNTRSTGYTFTTSSTRSAGRTRTPRPAGRRASQADVTPISPERDFQKVPNSITREMAARLFRGKSKQLYDYLWSQSRGAVVPTRTVRRSRPQLLRGAGFGSMGTVERCVDFLVEVGLIRVRTIVGEAEGNEYEVFTPEEVAPALFGLSPSPGTTPETGNTGSTLKQVIPVLPETGNTGSTSSSSESDVSGRTKTSFKTNTEKTDDEAFANFVLRFKQAAKEVTGREVTAAEANRWEDLAELLVTELKIAAGRTESVSSVPAFLTEHLRRRLWKKEKAQLEREASSASPAANQLQPKLDASKCPDCFGTGMYYPEGYEKGVARCGHDKLIKQV
jgi:hypothetical protein